MHKDNIKDTLPYILNYEVSKRGQEMGEEDFYGKSKVKRNSMQHSLFVTKNVQISDI